ncbi:MAG: NAD(P)H-dependent oxidoreductase [Alphaproteobacteria bacterium]|nr:NAD(P)H-dependent oxidoreductase [Alphaproteobacteria bacterium]
MKKILIVIAMILTSLISFNVKAEEGNMTDKKVLVAYFSATGTTAGVADKLAKVTGGELFEIKPAQPYSEADLDWRNNQSRSSVEMADMNSRPKIASKVENMSQYNVVFIGFPIWWYREPSIIDTFMESYDFAGKTVIPFATSGSSGMGKSGENMQKLAPNAKVFEGKRFPANVSEEVLKTWADEWL